MRIILLVRDGYSIDSFPGHHRGLSVKGKSFWVNRKKSRKIGHNRRVIGHNMGVLGINKQAYDFAVLR